MFQVRYDRSWHFFEIPFYILVGIFGGLYGAFVIKWNLRAQAFRKKYISDYAILEATLLAVATAIISYPNMFLRIDMTESMEILFLECEGAEDYQGLCEARNRWRMVLSLVLATIIRTFLVIISYGCKVPAGIFVPSMAIGASFGRTIGILVEALHESYPNAAFFSSCEPDVPCITPGTYAFLGAGAALSGIMHITVSVVVIMFELTGALTYILPTMIVVGVTKAVSELFGKGGIADRMIWFRGMPFLDNKEEHTFGVAVSHVMTIDPVVLVAEGMTVAEIDTIVANDTYQGFPVVEDTVSKILTGYIGRTEVRYILERARRERALDPSTVCMLRTSASSFPTQTPPMTPRFAAGEHLSEHLFDYDAHSNTPLDFSRLIDPVPMTVHPRLPLETVMELFRKIGPRAILIEYHGCLAGLVTVKDCLKWQFKVEAADSSREESVTADAQAKLWNLMQRVASVVARLLWRWSGGRIVLGTDASLGERAASLRRMDSRGSTDHEPMLDGTEDNLHDALELSDR
jgi:chloride channel 3/4/5